MDWQSKTIMTGFPGQGCQHKTARIRQSGQRKKEKTARKDRQKRTARAGQPERYSQYGTGMTEQAE